MMPQKGVRSMMAHCDAADISCDEDMSVCVPEDYVSGSCILTIMHFLAPCASTGLSDYMGDHGVLVSGLSAHPAGPCSGKAQQQLSLCRHDWDTPQIPRQAVPKPRTLPRFIATHVRVHPLWQTVPP